MKLIRDVEFAYIRSINKTRLRKILASFFAFIGLLWTIIEIAEYFFGDFLESVKLKAIIGNNFLYIVALLLLVSAHIHRKRRKIERCIKNTDIKITVEYCDIFNQKGAVIISGIDTFDTDIPNGLVSPRTLHGKLVSTFYAERVDQLDKEIKSSLEKSGETPLEINESLPGKKARYRIGTTVLLRPEGRTIYFMALSSMQANKNGAINPENIGIVLSNVWEYICEFGIYHDVVNIPVIATGKKKLPGHITNQYMVYEIINSFILRTIEKPICRNLRICLRDPDGSRYNLETVGGFIDSMNEYLALK